MRIGELSARTGASARSLRYYETLGLLQSTRSGNGYRHYEEAAVDRVRAIRSLLDLGFTTASVEIILPHLSDADASMDCAELIEHLTELLHSIEEKMARWETTRTALTEFLDRRNSPLVG